LIGISYVPLGRALPRVLIGGTTPFFGLLQNPVALPTMGDSPTDALMACTLLCRPPLELFSTRGSGEFDHAVSFEYPHALLTRSVDSTRQYKASSIVPTNVMDSTGCVVPINLRAILRVYRGAGLYSAGHSA
jgi:hypothetical protein